MHNVVLQEHLDKLENTYEANFKDAYITGNIKTDFEKTDFRGARLADIKITDAVFTECDFSGATITADITNAKFIRCNFDNAHFRHSHIYDSAFIDNKCMQTYFTHTSIRQTELSKNDFTIASMDAVIMSDISVKEPNMHERTIMFGFPGATREELEKMKENCINELSGVAEVYRQTEWKRLLNNDKWILLEKPRQLSTEYFENPDIKNVTLLYELDETARQEIVMDPNYLKLMEHGHPDRFYLGLVNGHKQLILGESFFDHEHFIFSETAKQEYDNSSLPVKEIASRIYEYEDCVTLIVDEEHLNHTPRQEIANTDNIWNNAIEEAMQSAEVPEPDFEMEM